MTINALGKDLLNCRDRFKSICENRKFFEDLGKRNLKRENLCEKRLFRILCPHLDSVKQVFPLADGCDAGSRRLVVVSADHVHLVKHKEMKVFAKAISLTTSGQKLELGLRFSARRHG